MAKREDDSCIRPFASFAKIQALVIDLDGVLYVGDQAIPGAADALAQLAARGLARRFITNTTTRTPGEVVAKLNSLGFAVDPDEIFSPVTATQFFLRTRRNGEPSVHLLVRDSIRCEFEEFPKDEESPDFVVVGDIGAAWSYPLLNRAFRQLIAGAELIAMHKNKFFQVEDGLILDIGAFVAGLEYVTGHTARIMGKPSLDFFRLGLDSLGLPPASVAMVGDDIDSDVGGGQAAGMGGILVKTGKFRKSYAESSNIQPDAIIDSIADLPALLKAR